MAYDAQGKMISNAPQGGWQVTSQQQTVQVGPTGQAERGVEVFFTTAQGVQASVFVSNAQYSPDNVKAAIAARAHQVDLVQQLHG